LRQAYDYWQDQPGSYFSTPPLRTGPRRYTASRKMPFPTVVHRNPFKPRDGQPPLSIFRRTQRGYTRHSISSYPRSHKSQECFSSSMDEDHTLRRRLPAMGFTHNEVRTITVDPQVIDRVRFGHQQEVHTSLHHRPTLQTSVFGLGFRPFTSPGAPFSSQRRSHDELRH